MNGAVTFDFHNTLAYCDRWFELEVRGLASAFLRWQAEGTGRRPTAKLLALADANYGRLRESIKEHGVEQTAGACLARVLSELDLPIDEDAIRVGTERLMRATLDEAAPLPGAVATVRALAAMGVPLGIVSSAVYHPFLEWSLERFGLRDAFGDVTTSASAGFYKSRPELFWHASRALGAAPERSVHVGDSYRFDVAGARRAGMGTVWLRGTGPTVDDEGGPPDLTLVTLVDAAPLIRDQLDRRAA